MDEGTTATLASPTLEHIIERPRLIELLEDSGARVVLLVAPAGYGKTTLARQWSARQSGPVAWHRTTRASGDVAALAVNLDNVLAAATEPRDRDPKRIGSIASVNARPAPLARALVSTYAHLTEDVLLVLDEWEAAGTDEAEELMTAVVDELAIRVLATSRTRPPWFTSRLTVYGEGLELGLRQLAMSDEEALSVLATGRRAHDPQASLSAGSRLAGGHRTGRYDRAGRDAEATRCRARSTSSLPRSCSQRRPRYHRRARRSSSTAADLGTDDSATRSWRTNRRGPSGSGGTWPTCDRCRGHCLRPSVGARPARGGARRTFAHIERGTGDALPAPHRRRPLGRGARGCRDLARSWLCHRGAPRGSR